MKIEDPREFLADLRDGVTLEEYVDRVWSLRYPGPEPKASNGWPYKSAAQSELPDKIRKIRP